MKKYPLLLAVYACQPTKSYTRFSRDADGQLKTQEYTEPGYQIPWKAKKRKQTIQPYGVCKRIPIIFRKTKYERQKQKCMQGYERNRVY